MGYQEVFRADVGELVESAGAIGDRGSVILSAFEGLFNYLPNLMEMGCHEAHGLCLMEFPEVGGLLFHVMKTKRGSQHEKALKGIRHAPTGLS